MKNWIGMVVVGRGQRERIEDEPGSQSHAVHQGRAYKEKERVCADTGFGHSSSGMLAMWV